MCGDDKDGIGASRLAADRATRATPQAPAGLGHSASIADAEEAIPAPIAKPMFGDLDKATPQQIGTILTCLTNLIDIYSSTVANANERYRKDCELLAGAMAEFTRICHFVARKGAEAIEAEGGGIAPAGPVAESDAPTPLGEISNHD